MSILTMEMMTEAMRKVGPPPMSGGFRGVNITVSPYALEDSDQRLFKKSRYRSKRIHKKLVKRFGGEFRKVPCIWQTPQGLVCHPEMYKKLKARLG